MESLLIFNGRTRIESHIFGIFGFKKTYVSRNLPKKVAIHFRMTNLTVVKKLYKVDA